MKLWTSFPILLVGVASVVFGQGQAEETLPGFKPTGVLESRGIDNVNPFNGDPGVIVPLGPEYTLGPGSKWQLQAYYSSKFWHYDDILCGLDPSVHHAFITGYPTLGVGWSLELGYIGPDPGFNYAGIYHSPTGHHAFQAGGTGCTGTGTYCTVDGTHLRVKYTSSPDQYTIEFPDGSEQTFSHTYTPPYTGLQTKSDFREDDWGVTPSARYGLTEIDDAFGTALLTVTYVATPSTDIWKVSKVNLTPNTTPNRSITFTWTTNTVGGSTWPVLDKIGFPSSANQTLTADFSFLSNPGTFPRSGWDNSASYPSCQTGHPVEVPFLSKIDFQNSSLSSLWTYSLLYNLPGTSVAGDGALKEITLPTAGKIQYTYGGTAGECLPSPGCPDPETGAPTVGPESPLVPHPIPYLDRSPGVLSRMEVDPFTNLTSTVNYSRQNFIPLDSQGQPDLIRVARWAVVTAPSGNGTGTVATRYVYRMEQSDFSEASGLEIERRYYDENALPTGTPIRTIIKCWETDSTSAKCGYRAPDGTPTGTIIGTLRGLNPRLQKSVTWYGVNPMTIATWGETCPPPSPSTNFCSQSVSSTYIPAAGKYNTTDITTNLMSMAGWTKRSTTTNWTPQTGTTAWLLNLFSSKSVTDTVSSPPVPISVSTTYAFNTTTGFLNSTTTTDGSNGTLTRSFTSTNGNPTAETAAGTSGLSGSFTDSRTFQSGLVTSRQRSSIAWKSFDVVRDTNGGVITESRDPNYSTTNSTLKTTYTYDALGRLTTVGVPGESTLRACYLIPTGVYPLFTLVGKGLASTCPKDDGAPPAGGWTTTAEGYQYDGFGRVIREIRRFPNAFAAPNDTYFARRETRYDAAGHRSYLSEWKGCTKDTATPFNPTDISSCAIPMPVAAGNPGTGTTWSDFDPFGRPRHIQRADSTTTDILYTDDGVTPNITHSDSLQKITVNGVGGTNPVTKIRQDVLGRVIFVREPSAETTNYKYNVLDKLAEVTQIRSSTTQTRTFTYDKFAFLRSEKHPEKWDPTIAPSGAPVTTTYGYDALGNVTSKVDGAPGATYSFTYDAAGRLTKESTGTSTYIVSCYDGSATNVNCVDGTANSVGGSYPLGHMTRGIGTNFIPTIATQIIDDFEWSTAAGRLTVHKSAIGNGDLKSATTESWTYTTLGLENTYFHPRSNGSFPVTTSYSTGLPTKVVANSQTVAQSVSYDPAGGLASWSAGNTGTAVVTTISQATSMMPRPSRIQATTTPAFDTGTYTYDGDGNITAGGDSGDVFTYDTLSRLSSAKLSGQTRAVAYDGFGNLTQNGGLTFTVDLANNHLTSGSATYDTRGNLTYYNGDTMSFDALNRQYRNQSVSSDWVYLYDGAGERAVKFGGSAYVLRREMARLIAEANIIAKGWALQSCAGIFQDVSCSDPDVQYIELVYNKGVTGGCNTNPLQYCPNGTLTRAQMATLVVKGYKLSGWTPPSCQGIFTDVTCGGPYAGFAPYIETLYQDGVTGGCNASPLQFCPGNPVKEWQILVWLALVPGTGSGVSWAAYHPVPRGATNGVTCLTLRDRQNRVATELQGGNAMDATSASLSVIRDNVFLGNLLVGYYDISSGPATWWFVVSDHLGSPRRLFKKDNTLTESHKYWPYGEDTNITVPAQKLAFGLMERNDGATRFYDHARHQDYNLGRFLSPDKVGGELRRPQSWNRYSYASNNPIARIDPNGLKDFKFVLQVTQVIDRSQVRGGTWRQELSLRYLGNNELTRPFRPAQVTSGEFKTTNRLVVSGDVTNGAVTIYSFRGSEARLGETKTKLGNVEGNLVSKTSPSVTSLSTNEAGAATSVQIDQSVFGGPNKNFAAASGLSDLTIGSSISVSITGEGDEAKISPTVTFSGFPTTFVCSPTNTCEEFPALSLDKVLPK
jgi:RHS repeat-associated protein